LTFAFEFIPSRGVSPGDGHNREFQVVALIQ